MLDNVWTIVSSVSVIRVTFSAHSEAGIDYGPTPGHWVYDDRPFDFAVNDLDFCEK
jgi:hypothetical protein